jgi:hypothetical protein
VKRLPTCEKLSVTKDKKLGNSYMDDQEEDLEEIATYKECHSHDQSFCFVKRHDHHMKMLIYPEDGFKRFWDISIAFVLIFSCFVTPYRVALIEEDT